MLFLGKDGDKNCIEAAQFCQANFSNVSVFLGKWGDSFPVDWGNWSYIISYLSRWIVPNPIIQMARIAAINFHPASPDYPGIGCNNFALYEGASQYGATCHHMAPSVDTGDTGEIIAVRRFPVFQTDNVDSLLQRTYAHQLVLFYEIVQSILEGKELPKSTETWARKPFTRRELNELSKITADMEKEEIARRIRATHFGGWKPTVELQGFTFEFRD